jgi:hypothetical protein
MHSLIRPPPAPSFLQLSGKISWNDLPQELQLAILELNLSAVDLIIIAAASKKCSKLIGGETSLWTKCSGLSSQSAWVSLYCVLSPETQEYIYKSNGPTHEAQMNDLDEALLAAEKAVMQSKRGQHVDIIRRTIDEAVKHAKYARIDFNSLSPDFLNLARPSSAQIRTFALAEGCRSSLASTYDAIERLCSQPQKKYDSVRGSRPSSDLRHQRPTRGNALPFSKPY